VPASGVVFKLSPRCKETVLYNFLYSGKLRGRQPNPWAVLIFDARENLYGTPRREVIPRTAVAMGVGRFQAE